jgi:hypothetical protein
MDQETTPKTLPTIETTKKGRQESQMAPKPAPARPPHLSKQDKLTVNQVSFLNQVLNDEMST